MMKALAELNIILREKWDLTENFQQGRDPS